MATNTLDASQMVDRDPMIRGTKTWFTTLGSIAAVVGAVTLILAGAGGSAMTSGLTVGLVFAVAAVVQALFCWRSTLRTEAVVHVTIAILYGVVAIALTKADGGTINRLTGVLGFYFAVMGILRVVTTIRLQLTFWPWNLSTAIVTSALGAITLFQMPNANPRIFAALIGLDLLYYGIYALDLGLKGTKISGSRVDSSHSRA